MAKILIPSRNRPGSLRSVLGYLAHFYPKSEVIVADGSNEEYRLGYEETIKSVKDTLSVEHRVYDAEFPFFDRILDALNSISDELVIMGADDDYPVMSTMKRGEAFLQKNPDFSTAMGSIIHFKLDKDEALSVRLGHAKNLGNPVARTRAMVFSHFPFSTTYAVTRREHLIERYQRANETFLANFFDFVVGLHDCTAGKLKAFPTVGYFCTRNYKHSYLRADDQLIYLRRADEVLRLVDIMKDDLVNYGGLSDSEAKKVSVRLIRRRISHLADKQPFNIPGFSSHPTFKNSKIVQKQYKEFHGLFIDGHPSRLEHLDTIKYIVSELKSQASQTRDNLGEKASYETFQEQVVSRKGK